MKNKNKKNTNNKGAEKKNKNSAEKTKKLLRKIAVTAIFSAFAVALKVFTNIALNIPVVGIKVGFAGIFTFFPAVICGPVWGGISSALSDILGFLIAPDGAYIPWLTVTAFCGGVIKGLLWMLLTKKAGKNLRIIMLAVFIAAGAAGASFHISLSKDGFINGFIAKQEQMPSKGAVIAMQTDGSISPLSSFAADLAKYKNDTVTLKSASGDGETVLPSRYVKDGYETKITKIGSKALENVTGILTIPETYKTVADDALGENKAVTLIRGRKGSAAESFAEKNGVSFEEVQGEEEAPQNVFSDTVNAGFTVSDSDAYRKNLALSLNMLVLGLEAAGLVGIVFTVVNAVFAKSREKSEKPLEFIKIAFAVTVAGLITTTVNTFILRELLDAWRGREFMILYIPRLIEEIIVCTVHSYIISILYGAVVNGRIKQSIQKLK